MQQDPNRPGAVGSSRIQHSHGQLGAAPTKPAADLETEPLPVAENVGPSTAAPKITAFGKEQRHEEKWSRTPNTTGHGAIHVRTFRAKLTDDALVYMDQCINEWLDAHPQYEVKFVNSTVGILTGKLKEPNLVCQVWV
jgi:hypothetical protein